jgi:hypothetical protein
MSEGVQILSWISIIRDAEAGRMYTVPQHSIWWINCCFEAASGIYECVDSYWYDRTYVRVTQLKQTWSRLFIMDSEIKMWMFSTAWAFAGRKSKKYTVPQELKPCKHWSSTEGRLELCRALRRVWKLKMSGSRAEWLSVFYVITLAALPNIERWLSVAVEAS